MAEQAGEEGMNSNEWRDRWDKELSAGTEIGWEAWGKLHCRCPDCKGNDYCIATDGGPANRVTCACGWKGIEWDLVAD